MSWPRRRPFGPIKIPAGRDWDSIFEEIEPIVRERDGRVLKRYRVRGTDIIGVESPLDTLFEIEVTEFKPLPMPSSDLFCLEFKPLKPYAERTDEEKAEADARVAEMRASEVCVAGRVGQARSRKVAEGRNVRHPVPSVKETLFYLDYAESLARERPRKRPPITELASDFTGNVDALATKILADWPQERKYYRLEALEVEKYHTSRMKPLSEVILPNDTDPDYDLEFLIPEMVKTYEQSRQAAKIKAFNQALRAVHARIDEYEAEAERTRSLFADDWDDWVLPGSPDPA